MLNMEFVTLTGRLLRVDCGRVLVVREEFETKNGKPFCSIYVADAGELAVRGSYKDVLTRLEQKDTVTDRYFVRSDEAVHVFGLESTPTLSQWREMSLAARIEWDRRFKMSGMVTMRCPGCGYPSGSGSTCPTCQPEEKESPS